jgi:hypothetical protein
MRNLTILFVFISFQISLAQNYIPFPDSGAIWINYRYTLVDEPFYHYVFSGADNYCINGEDTIINSNNYTKLNYCNGNYKVAIRSDNGRVYFVPPDSVNEFLLYDFTVEEGDTLDNYYTFWSEPFLMPSTIIGSIDSVSLNGVYHKRIQVDNSYWIEGIGCSQGLFIEPWPNVSGAAYELYCMSHDDTTLYPQVSYTNCLTPITVDCSDTTYLPTITGPSVVCAGDTILLEAESGYDAYLWSTGDTTQSIAVSDSGDYFVSALVDTCWFGSDTLTIMISNPQPFIVENASHDSLFCIPEFASYQWYYNFQPVSGETNQFFCLHLNGNYQVFVTDSFGCTAMSPSAEIASAKTDSPCGLPGSVIDNSKAIFNLYPNPATTTLTIEFPASATFKNAELSIQTITGQVVNELIIDNEKLTINVQNFSKGLYLIKVRAGDEVVVKKVVVD